MLDKIKTLHKDAYTGRCYKLLNTPLNWRVLGIVCLMLPLVPPTTEALSALFGGTIASVAERFLTVWRYGSYCFVAVYFLRRLKYVQINRCVSSVLVIGLVICLLFSTVRNGGLSLARGFIELAGVLMLFLLACSLPGEKFSLFVEGAYIWLTVAMIANSVTMYLYYPNGLYQSGYLAGENSYYLNPNYYLFGLDNACFMYSLTGCSMGLIHRCRHGRLGLTLPLVYAFIFGAYFYTNAGTAMAIVACLIALVVLVMFNKSDFITYKFVLVIGSIAFVGICLLNTLGVFEDFLSLIGKDATFSNRTFIWAAVFQAMNGHQLLGFGLSDAIMHLQLGMASGSLYISNIGHVHNVLLEIYFRGGYLSAAFFVSLLLGPLRRMTAVSSSKTAQLASGLLLLLWLTCMFEFRLNTYTFWLVPICVWHVNDLLSAEAKDGFRHAK